MVLRVSSDEQMKWNKQKIGIWSSRFLTTLLTAITIFIVLVGLSSKLHANTPQLFGREMYVILSGSMEPELHTGSVVLDRTNVDTKDLKLGDIITFRLPAEKSEHSDNEKMLVTHRITKILKQDGTIGFKTKGDNNATEDAWIVRPNDIVAIYDNITIPYIGYVINFLKTSAGIACAMIALGLYGVGITLYKYKKDIMNVIKET